MTREEIEKRSWEKLLEVIERLHPEWTILIFDELRSEEEREEQNEHQHSTD